MRRLPNILGEPLFRHGFVQYKRGKEEVAFPQEPFYLQAHYRFLMFLDSVLEQNISAEFSLEAMKYLVR